MPAFTSGSGGGDSNPRPLGYEPNELPLLHPATGCWLVAMRSWLAAIGRFGLAVVPPATAGGGCPRRPRLPGGRPPSTLRRCAGSRPGSGWDRVGPARSRPRAPPTRHTGGRDDPLDAPPPPGAEPGLLSARPRALIPQHCAVRRVVAAPEVGPRGGCPSRWRGPPRGRSTTTEET